MVNQARAARGLERVGFVNPALYTLATGPLYSDVFHDVTTGNNGWFPAVTGYDLATGWGTIRGNNLLDALSGVEPSHISSSSSPARYSLHFVIGVVVRGILMMLFV